MSADIGTYNAFVTSEAGLAYSTGTLGLIAPQATTNWNVIGSTSAVDATINAPAPAGMPVFDTQGDLLSTDLYNFNTSLNQQIEYDEFGGYVSPGTEIRTGYPGGGLGSPGSNPLGTPYPDGADVGSTFWTNSNWIHWSYIGDPTVNVQMYALSSAISVPEPTTGVLLLGAALLGVGVVISRWRGK